MFGIRVYVELNMHMYPLYNGLIDDCIFVSVVVMTLASSRMSGPMMNGLLSHRIAVARLTLRRAEAEPADG